MDRSVIINKPNCREYPSLGVQVLNKTIYIEFKPYLAFQSILKQDHCRGVYLPLSIKGEEIPFPRYSQFFIFR